MEIFIEIKKIRRLIFMAFRFDMQGKTPQQQIIVAKRDTENKRRQQDPAKKESDKKITDGVNTNYLILAIDKDNCPNQDNIIIKEQCSGCKYYKDFTLYNGHPCIICSHELSD